MKLSDLCIDFRQNKRYCFSEPYLPTQYNLIKALTTEGWQPAPTMAEANFGDANLDFHHQAAQTLEFKHTLADLVAQYCPQVMPITYNINDENWSQVLQKNKHFITEKMAWILKPALLNNGQHIHLFKNIEEIAKHFANYQRLGGEHVLQEYIIDPHLLRDRRKYSIRQFLILSNFIDAYLYPQGYFNVAKHPYMPEAHHNLSAHLTNEHLYGEESNVIQIPTDRFSWFAEIYPQITAITQSLITALKQAFPQAFTYQKLPTLAIFGLDFMLDSNMRVWLLEANHGPCFPIDEKHPLQQYLYKHFWKMMINKFVLGFTGI